MRVGLQLPRTDAGPAATAEWAEELGYRSVWVGELWGPSAPVVATEVAAATRAVGVGTAVLNVFSRSPAVLAATAVSLDRVSDGRTILGLGTSTPKAVRDLHGMAFDRPVRRAHETIELVRRFTRGDGQVEYEGEVFSVTDFPSLDHEVPVYHAALGPANRRVVGRLCDGWIPHNVPFPALEGAFETVADAARDAGRRPDAIEVAPYVPAAVGEDAETAREAIRSHVAYYVGSGDGYRRAVSTCFPDEADRIAECWANGDRGRARATVTDEMVDALGVAGTPGSARDRLRRLVEETVVDHPIVVVPGTASDDLRDSTVEALAP